MGKGKSMSKNTAAIRLNVAYLPIEKIEKYSKNARTHSAEQVQQIAASISQFGFTNPLLIDERGGLIAGHGRLAAALSLGMVEVPTIMLAGLSENQKRAYVLADNKIALNAGWDEEMLAAEILALSDEGFDMALTGFTDDEIADLLPAPHADAENGWLDYVPPPPVAPVTRPGDLWVLGSHRLLCGDSTSPDAVSKLLNGACPNLMVTDPPYGVEYEAGWRAEAKSREKTEREETSKLKNDDRADWRAAWILFPGNVAYVWHASAFTDVVKQSLENAGFPVRQQIIWNKNVHALSRSAYHWKHEPCWYAVREGCEANWLAGRNQMTVWDIPSVIFEKDKTAHPTQKALGIYERPVENHTKKGESVYEPFGGSGTAIVVCEMMARTCYCMELDEKFCDVIIERWQRLTGKQAVKESTGQTFSELKAA